MRTSEKKYKLIHFCVLYGESTHLLNLFESIKRQIFDFIVWPIALVVINNNEAVYLPAEISNFKFQPGIDFFIVNPGKNLGYFGAAQWAFQKFHTAQWTIISNSDLIFADTQFFAQISELRPKKKCGVLAPQITSEISGLDQNPYMVTRPNPRKMKLLKWIFSFDFSSLLYQGLAALKSSMAPKKPQKVFAECEIYAPHGSFIIFHENYFSANFDFSHPPFLFGEEITVAENILKAKLTANYKPTLKIRHQEHKTTGKFPNRKIRRYIAEASKYCAEKYF